MKSRKINKRDVYQLLPENQDWLIEQAKFVDYYLNEDGVCYGLCHMAMLAIFNDSFEESFCLPLQYLYNTSGRMLNNKIQESRKIFNSLVKEAELEVANQANTEGDFLKKETNDKENDKYKENIKKEIELKKQRLSQSDQDKLAYLDIPPLLEGILLNQTPESEKDLFPNFQICYKKKPDIINMIKNKLYLYLDEDNIMLVSKNSNNEVRNILLNGTLSKALTVENIKKVLNDPNKSQLLSDYDSRVLFHVARHQFANEKHEITSFSLRQQNAIISMPFSFSGRLEKNSIKYVSQTINNYTQKDLHYYLSSFARQLKKHNFMGANAFIITNNNHALMVSYDFDFNRWLLIDAYFLPVIVGDHKKIAHKITKCFSQENNESLSLSIILYTLTSDYLALNEVKEKWYQETEFIRMHDFTLRDLNHVDSSGGFLLCIASEFDNVNLIEKILDAGANVNQANNEGETALIIAASNGHVEALKTLLAVKNIDIDFKAPGLSSALFAAVSEGYLEIVQLLLKAGAASNQVNQFGSTALMVAIRENHFEIAKVLLKAGAIDKPNHGHLTALLLCIRDGFNVMSAVLLTYQANAQIEGKISTERLLAFAKEHNRLVEVNDLIKLQNENNIPSMLSFTPIEASAFFGRFEILKKIFSLGIKLTEKQYHKVLLWAKVMQHEAMVGYLESRKAEISPAFFLNKKSNDSINTDVKKRKLS